MWRQLRKRATRPKIADRGSWPARGAWFASGLALCAGSILVLALGVPATVVVPVLLGAFPLVSLLAGGKVVQRALDVTRARAEQQMAAAEARFGAGVARAHDWIRVEGDLRGLLDTEELDHRLRVSIERAVEAIESLREAMRATSPARKDRGGSAPPIGGHAADVLERVGGSLKPYAWTPQQLVPERLRGAGSQFSLILDEVRVLHNADVERAVLLFTLAARAVLVTLAPLLGAWTQGDTPVADTGLWSRLVWVAAATISLATFAMAPRVVDTAMTDSDDATRFRRHLLRLELPVALLATVLLPVWTVVVFSAGWTNWWQRQTPHLEFDWGKLAVFVAAVAGLQSAGLTIQSLPTGSIALEVALSLLVIAVIGASYGAMLPLATATVLAVLVGDGSRSIRSARRARGNLLDCARHLRSTAAEIDAAAPEIPLAVSAATMSRQAALKLEREADLFGRRGLLSPQVLAELCDQAIGFSNLYRRDSAQLEIQRRAARERDQPEPAFAMEPILGSLAEARVAKQRHARTLRSILVTAYNEAGVHGTDGVKVSLEQLDGRLCLLVCNLPRPDSEGTSGEGAARIERLASKLPGGAMPRPPGLRSPDEIDSFGKEEWWTIELHVDLTVLTRS